MVLESDVLTSPLSATRRRSTPANENREEGALPEMALSRLSTRILYTARRAHVRRTTRTAVRARRALHAISNKPAPASGMPMILLDAQSDDDSSSMSTGAFAAQLDDLTERRRAAHARAHLKACCPHSRTCARNGHMAARLRTS